MNNKTFIYLILAVIALISISCDTTPRKRKVIICATTDIHGRYFDSLYVGGRTNQTSLANVSTYIKQLCENGDNPVLIDVGDNLQGDNAAYFFNYVHNNEEHLFSKITKYLKYDALVVGNHDIETGHDVYDKFRKEVKIPYMAANAIITEGQDKGRPYFDPYTIVRRNGLKIAVIGMTNPCIKSWLSPSLWSGMEFGTLTSVAQKVTDMVIAKEKPDIVVMAVHSGIGDGSESNFENSGKLLASQIRGVDLILCGHDHHAAAKEVDNPNGNVVVLDAGSKCVVVAQCEISVERKNGEISSKSISYRLVPMSDIPIDKDYTKTFKREYNLVKNFTNRVIGYLADDLYFSDAQDGPSSYLNLIHTVQMSTSGAEISFAAPLTKSGKIDKGSVTYQDLFTIYPFENQLYVINLTGSQIKNYLEYSYDCWINKIGPSFNYDSAAGIIYTVSKSAEKGNRVTIVSMENGDTFDLSKTYKVAINSYRASGAGGLLTIGAGVDADNLDDITIHNLPEIRELLSDYIVKHKEIYLITSTNWKFVE